MSIDEPTETEPQRIARGLRLRDADLISELVERYHHRLVRYLVWFLGGREHVEDLVQETWLRALDRADLYDGLSRFEPWLFAIAHHLAVDGVRKRRGATLDAIEITRPGESLHDELRASDHSSPFVAAARSEDASRLAAALDALNASYREALVLRFHEDLSLQEISEIAGVPVSTVSSRIQRALAFLRSHWEGGTNAL